MRIALLALILLGCASAPTVLDTMQHAVQDCILSGGHAHLGPGDTIDCVR